MQQSAVYDRRTSSEKVSRGNRCAADMARRVIHSYHQDDYRCKSTQMKSLPLVVRKIDIRDPCIAPHTADSCSSPLSSVGESCTPPSSPHTADSCSSPLSSIGESCTPPSSPHTADSCSSPLSSIGESCTPPSSPHTSVYENCTPPSVIVVESSSSS